MRSFVRCTAGAFMLAFVAGTAGAAPADPRHFESEEMPPGFQVVATELEGPVFADPNGKTLYTWPLNKIRNGDIGEVKGKAPTCSDEVQRTTSGYMSPYPGGFELPELDKRPSCTQEWPPVIAAPGAEPVGKFAIIEGPRGRQQWSYDGYPLYTSVRDQQPGDVLGSAGRQTGGGDGGVYRVAIRPKAGVPPAFGVFTVQLGRLIALANGYSIYTSDRDGVHKSNCDATCQKTWRPVSAGVIAQANGDWTVFERAPGLKQWAYKGKPVYTHTRDDKERSYQGGDVLGWHNVWMQLAPAAPSGFTVQDTHTGQVLASPNGKTIYLYSCTDDAHDQMLCDHPGAPQAYRFAICGGGDPARCVRTFPYILAEANAKSTSRAWGIMSINPTTGKEAKAGDAGALRVWTFRNRPVYNFAGDKQPGDVEGDAWGEFNGRKNGFKAFWLRDDFDRNGE
jgi:predicted lipoprotein with Yx(FWY)xxD motif